jgi:hypothetical protein
MLFTNTRLLHLSVNILFPYGTAVHTIFNVVSYSRYTIDISMNCALPKLVDRNTHYRTILILRNLSSNGGNYEDVTPCNALDIFRRFSGTSFVHAQ